MIVLLVTGAGAYRSYSVSRARGRIHEIGYLIHWEEQGPDFRQFLLKWWLVSLALVIPAFLISGWSATTIIS